MNNLDNKQPSSEPERLNEQSANYRLAKLFETVFLEIRRLAWYDPKQNAQDSLFRIGELADLFHCVPKALLTSNPDWSHLERLSQAAVHYQSSHKQTASYDVLIDQTISSLRQLKNSRLTHSSVPKARQPELIWHLTD